MENFQREGSPEPTINSVVSKSGTVRHYEPPYVTPGGTLVKNQSTRSNF